MKPGCGKCFKVAEKNGNEYVCPSCGDVVAQIPTELSGTSPPSTVLTAGTGNVSDENYVRAKVMRPLLDIFS